MTFIHLVRERTVPQSMKKRYSIPLATLAAFVGLMTLAGISVHKNTVACAGGDLKVCKELVRVHGSDFNDQDEIPSSLWEQAVAEYEKENGEKIAIAKAKAEKAQAEKEKADKSEKVARKVKDALHACEHDQIIGQLKDPGSYRFVDYKPVFLDEEVMIVNIEYSAKNAFGGRVRSNHRCAYRFN